MKMTAITVSTPGGPQVLRLQEIHRPVPRSGEVLIRVKATGVNRPDILQREGKYPPPPGASPILGLEVSGIIEQRGDNTGPWQKGDEIVALTNGGGYAQFVCVPAGQVLPLPKGFDFVQGAALPETLFTIQQTLIDRAGLRAGQSTLIHAGASGIGATAIQLARLRRAVPFVSVSSKEKAAYATSQGAKAAILYRDEDFVAAILALTEGHGVDVIVDIVGGDYLSRNLDALAPGGTIIQLAMLGASKSQINLAQLLAKRATLFGSTLRAQPDALKAQIAGHLRQQVWPALASGRFVKPRIQTFSLEQAGAAHEAMEARSHYGKIVLCP